MSLLGQDSEMRFNYRSILNQLTLALVLVSVSLSIAACDQSTEPVEIAVGAILPLSGTLSAPGVSVKNGMDLALEEINAENSFNLRFVVEDTKSIIDTALVAYSRLADDEGVQVIIGPLTSSETESVIPLVNEKNVVTLSPTSAKIGLSAQSKFLFRSQLTVDRVVPEGVRISKKQLGFTHVATMFNQADAFSVSSNDFITEELGKYSDVSIVQAVSYNRRQGVELGDITAELSAIRDAVPTPSAIFLSALPEGRMGVPIATFRMGLSIPLIINFVSIEVISSITDAEPGAAEDIISFQVWMRDSELAESKAFVESYRNRFGEVPGDLAARGYAGVTILGEALKNIKAYDAASIRDGLNGIREFNSIFGPFSFDANGDAVHDPVIAQVRDNQFVVLSE